MIRPVLAYWARKARPQYRGELSLPELNRSVQVRWDSFSIPHIFATNEADMFAAQGYLHAQERLWQMDLSRRFFSGRLSEIFGDKKLPYHDLTRHLKESSTIEVDYFMRVMGIRNTARLASSMLAEASARDLEAYCGGVNAYMDSHQRRLPVEFCILRYAPDPWTPEDCLTVAKGFALLLSAAFLTRLVFAAIADRLRDEPVKLRSLAPSSSEWPCITRVDTGEDLEEAAFLLKFLCGTFGDGPWWPGGQGSNSWVLSAARGVDGHPRLCNDPHLRLTAPCVWYLNHLRATHADPGREFAAWGASLPGSPYVYIGHNRRIAWGITAALCDDADLFYERLDPSGADRYQAGDAWLPFERRSETLTVRGRGRVMREVRSSRHGPVVSDVLAHPPVQSLDRAKRESGVLSLSWTGHIPADEIQSVAGINRAQTWAEFLGSLSHHVAPSLNYVYADIEDNIGYTLAGKIPIRAHTPDWLPLPGWTDDHNWSGYIPFEELPRLYNPPEGAIATANNRITDSAYPYYLSELFEPPYRIDRIRALLTAKRRFSHEDMASMQQDTRSLLATAVLNAVAAELHSVKAQDPSLAESVDLLLQWDGRCEPESPGAGLFHVFYTRLMWNVWGKDLGTDLYTAYTEILNQPVRPLNNIIESRDAAWFQQSSLEEVVRTSLAEARAHLVETLGAAPGDWAWGKFHTVRLQHALGTIKPLASYFALGPFPSAGDGSTVNNAHYPYSMPFEQTIGPAFRLVVSLEEPVRSHVVLMGGQSGHPSSRHYGDQIDLWRGGDYIRLAHTEREMEDWPLLTLRPHAGGGVPRPVLWNRKETETPP